MGELSLFTEDVVGLRSIIWTKKGDQGNVWRSEEVDGELSLNVTQVSHCVC